MSLREQFETATANRDGGFPSTRWSVVCQARSNDPAAGAALAELCRTYWRPVYSFLRGQGKAPHDAEDLTQGFFVMLLDQNLFATVDEAKGRLRSFLLVALKRYAANEHKRERTQKRGGGSAHVSIEAGDAEERYAEEMATGLAPDLLFERRWALTLLNTVLAKLRADYARDGHADLFDALKDRFSTDDDPASLASVAQQLGMTEGAVKVAVHRMRQRYRKILRNQIAFTVGSLREVDDEIMHLYQIFRGPG
jgi:RNA polymerase sigma-70 factor (ECF subfamily)